MTPLFLDFTDPAEAEISGAIEYARAGGGDTAAELFAERVAQAITGEAERLAGEVAANVTGKPFESPDEAASIRYARPVYRLRVETASKRRKGSSAGLWYLYFALISTQDDAKPDTMQVVSFRHSAARPIGDDGNSGLDRE